MESVIGFIISLIAFVFLLFMIAGVNSRLDKVIDLLKGGSAGIATAESTEGKDETAAAEAVNEKNVGPAEMVVVFLVVVLALGLIAWAF